MPNNGHAKKSAGKPIMASDIPLTNPQGIESVYANEVGLGFTLTDVRLIFAEVGADATSGKGSKFLRANVVIPLAVADAFAQGLLASLQTHKKNLQAMQDANKQAAKT